MECIGIGLIVAPLIDLYVYIWQKCGAIARLMRQKNPSIHSALWIDGFVIIYVQ